MSNYLRHLLESHASSIYIYEKAMATALRLEGEGAPQSAVDLRIRMAEGALDRCAPIEAEIAERYPDFSGPWLVVTATATKLGGAWSFAEKVAA